MREERDEGVQGLRKVKKNLSNLRKMNGRLWVGAEQGFSLIELIGVLAIMGILASMTVPPILRQIRQAQSGNEDANLNEVARAIVEGIKVTGTIPNPNVNALAVGGWASNSLSYTALGTNQLLYVSDANANTQRRMYLSGGLTNYFSANLINPPFITPASGWPTNSFPSDLQIVLVSSSREDLLLSCSTTANLASNDVVWLKNWVKQATNGIYFAANTEIVGGIANSTGTWTNKGEFLHVKTVDLRPLFCRVELIDTAAPVVVDMANAGSGYNSTPSPTNINGTTISYLTNGANTNVSILNFFPAQRQSGLTNRGTNTSLVTNQVLDPGGVPLLYATNRITTPGAPQFEINSLGATTIPNQQTNFYLIQGTTLRLISPTNVTTNSSTIQKDCQFEYYGGNWRQLY
jgi:prepilin-type N-terminal cleavage/methylation domain-containing protein